MDAEQAARGCRLVTLMSRPEADGPFGRFMGVWRAAAHSGASGSGVAGENGNDPTQQWWAGDAADVLAFQQVNAEQLAAGRRLVAFPPYGLNAVWRSGGGPQQVAVAVGRDELEQTDADLLARGMRLVDLGVGGWD